MKRISILILILTITACSASNYRAAAIRERLAETSGLAAHNIAINEQTAGDITLTGNVASDKDRDTIEKVARNTSGVENFRSDLVIVPSSVTIQEGYPAPVSPNTAVTNPTSQDLLISQNVRTALIARGDLDLRNVEITTTDQIVRLRGFQNTKRDIDNLVYNTERVAGVRAVINELSVYDNSNNGNYR